MLTLLVGLFSVDYTVERGDTLSKIASETGVPVADLVEANNISNPNLIRIGQVLVIPGEEGSQDVIHVVVRGDTIGRIARQYGSSISALVEANGIANANLIRIGQSITVPGSAGASPDSSDESMGDTGEEPASNSESVGTGGETPESDSDVRSETYHIVKSGESLADIAAQYSGVTAEQIARANGIVNNLIYVGTRLFLDGDNYVAEGSASSGGTYSVRSGDRLGDIAAFHGTNISTLAEMNDLADINLLRVGQVLEVPGTAAWVCPVDGGRFFNDWGFPRGGGARFHEGNDIFAPHGTPVRAPVSGFARQKEGLIGGFQVNLDGNDGVMYLASHMSAYGESGRVSAGDIIGYVGNSGNAVGTSPHLHFGMYDDGKAINPYPSLIANGCK
jgi:LysM repeat protein